MKQIITQTLIGFMLRLKFKWARQIILWAIIRLPAETVDIDIWEQVAHGLLCYYEKNKSYGKV